MIFLCKPRHTNILVKEALPSSSVMMFKLMPNILMRIQDAVQTVEAHRGKSVITVFNFVNKLFFNLRCIWCKVLWVWSGSLGQAPPPQPPPEWAPPWKLPHLGLEGLSAGKKKAVRHYRHLVVVQDNPVNKYMVFQSIIRFFCLHRHAVPKLLKIILSVVLCVLVDIQGIKSA